jgi:hypothetical protein
LRNENPADKWGGLAFLVIEVERLVRGFVRGETLQHQLQ